MSLLYDIWFKCRSNGFGYTTVHGVPSTGRIGPAVIKHTQPASSDKMPATPGRCLHYTNGRTWKCKRCKALDRNRGILGGGRCAHNKLLAGCTLCSTGSQHEKCVHGMLSRRCTQGCARGTSICPCGKRATECSSCAREGVLCPHLRRWRSCNNKSCSRRGILQGNIVKLDYVQANLVDKDCEFKPAGSLC